MGVTSNYLRKLYRLSRSEVQMEFGTKGATVLLALKIGFTAVGISLLVLLKLLENTNPIYQTVLGIFASDILGLVVLFILTPVYAVLKIPQVAARQDENQRISISNLKGSKRIADKINIKEITNDVSSLIEIHNGDTEEFRGYLQVWKVNDEKLYTPIKLFYIYEEIKNDLHTVADIRLSRDEYMTLAFVFIDEQEKLPVIIGEHGEKRHLDRGRNFIESKLFGFIGDEAVIPKDVKWEVIFSKSGKLITRKIG